MTGVEVPDVEVEMGVWDPVGRLFEINPVEVLSMICGGGGLELALVEGSSSVSESLCSLIFMLCAETAYTLQARSQTNAAHSQPTKGVCGTRVRTERELNWSQNANASSLSFPTPPRVFF